MYLFPSSRWASAIQIVRPLQSTAETQPQLQPAFAQIVSNYLPLLHAFDCAFFALYTAKTK